MLAIYKRELKAYLKGPLGYIFVSIFLMVSGFLFSYFTLQQGADSDVGSYFIVLLFVFIVVLPLLTMKLFSEERKLKTEQLLLTAPVSLPGMVIAKFLAAYTLFGVTFLVSCLGLVVLASYSEPNVGTLFGYIIGILLIGGALLSIGVFVSSLTENQFIAAISTIAITMFFILIGFLASYVNTPWIATVLGWVSILSRFYNFTYGTFDIIAIVYYISIAVVFLFLTVRIYEKRRWE